MFHLNWILLLIILIIRVLKVELSITSISFIPRYFEQNIELVCDVRSKGAIDWNIYLSCPFTESRICYTKCKPNCQSDNCFPMITNCSIENLNEEHIRLKWTVNIMQIHKSGDWQCSQRDVNSNSVLIKSVPKSRSQNITKERTTQKPIKLPVVKTVPSSIDRQQLHGQDKNSNERTYTNHFWEFITRPFTILILVCVFTLSLILNIIFIIRCALFRSFLDNYLQAKKSPDTCLLRCFCIPVNQSLPTANKKYPIQSNPTAYITYHRDEIYDDMSSGSQTDRHLINNYSHYEIDHDSVLSRKVWSSDGSHNILNRQSNMSLGQPMGNYVIVSGPVCTNRNHIALNTPSNASLVSNSLHTYTTDAMGRSSSNEFQRPDFCPSNDVIYSQPLKNRTRSFDPALNDEISIKYMSNFKRNSPPIPPERNSNEQIHQESHMMEPIAMNPVDLIEHYTHATAGQTMDEKCS